VTRRFRRNLFALFVVGFVVECSSLLFLMLFMHLCSILTVPCLHYTTVAYVELWFSDGCAKLAAIAWLQI